VQQKQQKEPGAPESVAQAGANAVLCSTQYPAVAVNDQCMTIKALGKLLGHPRLKAALKARGFINASGLPNPRYIACRYFAVIARANGRLKTVVLASGMAFLAGEYPPTAAAFAAAG
jgi:hypothetical protein